MIDGGGGGSVLDGGGGGGAGVLDGGGSGGSMPGQSPKAIHAVSRLSTSSSTGKATVEARSIAKLATRDDFMAVKEGVMDYEGG